MTAYLTEIQIGPQLFNPNNLSPIFRVGHDRSSHWESNSATTIYLTKIQIWPRPFNPNNLSPWFIFGHYCLIPSPSPKKYKNFKNISLVGFKFGPNYFILSLLPQKYQYFQDTSLLGFKFGHDRFVLSFSSQKYQFKKKKKKNLSPTFRFGHDHLSHQDLDLATTDYS